MRNVKDYERLTCNKVSTSGRQLGTRPRKTIWSAWTPIRLNLERCIFNTLENMLGLNIQNILD